MKIQMNNLYAELKKLIDNQDVDNIKIFINEHPELNYDDLLLVATKKGSADVVKAIMDREQCGDEWLKQTVSSHYAHSEGNTLLMVAAEKGFTDIVKLFLSNKSCTADYLAQVNSQGETALLQTIVGGRDEAREIAQLLLESEYSTSKMLEQPDGEFNRNVLGWMAPSVHKNEDEIFKFILKSKACRPELLEHVDDEGDNALRIARRHENYKGIRCVLQSGHCPEQLFKEIDEKGNTLLIDAVIFGDIKLVKIILESEYCDQEFLEQANSEGDTAQQIALNLGCHDIFDAILERVTAILKSKYKNALPAEAYSDCKFWELQPFEGLTKEKSSQSDNSKEPDTVLGKRNWSAFFSPQSDTQEEQPSLNNSFKR